MTRVVGQAVAAAGSFREGRHGLLDDAGDAGVERVHGLARLEVDVRVLRGSTDERTLGRKRASAMSTDEIFGYELAQVVVGERLDRIQLVRRSEPVEEVHERHTRAQCRGLRDERQIVSLLDGRRSEQRKACLPDCHHVGVVAEDRKALSRERTGSNVQHRRGELPRDLVHVRDHEQQALRCGERRREGAALQRAVESAGGTSLALHLDDGGDASPQVRPPLTRPLVGKLGHRRRRSDRVDAADLVESVGNRRRRLVPVEHHGHLRPPRRPSRSRARDTARSTPHTRYNGRNRTGSAARHRA